MRRTLVFNPERCLACSNCELACSVAHSGSGRLETAIGEQLRPRRRVTLVAGKNGVEALRCEQCGEPLCAFSCKAGAIYRHPETGETVIDEARCVACYMCLMVCPWGVRPDPARDRVVRCDVCHGLDTPACVAACPTGALGARAVEDRRARSDFSGHVVVVGSSAAGIAACEAARDHAPECSITLVTADGPLTYSRPLLAYALAGRLEVPQLGWRDAAHVEGRLRVQVIHSANAIRLETGARRLVLDSGEEVAYDRLIVATGARGVTLSIPGADLPGVCTLRSLEDLQKIGPAVVRGRRAVVLGGGNVGLQTCEAFLERGMAVTVVVKSGHLLSQMVDEEAGRRVEALFTGHGLNVRTRRDAVAIIGDGRVEGVRLDDGELVPADVVVVGKGIQPNIEWLAGSGVEMRRGLVVDLHGRTSAPDVFAAGDCAEVADPLTGRPSISGIWPVAYEMGRAAGATAVGVQRQCAGALRMNASRFFGVPVISIGEVLPGRLDGASAQILANREDVYRKLIFRGPRLAGALLFGDISGAGIFYRLYREGVELGEELAAEIGETNEIRTLGPLVAAAVFQRELL